jgi:hypothetical protein
VVEKTEKQHSRKIAYSVAGALVVVALTLGSSVYARRVLNTTELVHFFVPFPAGRVVRPRVVARPDGRKIFVRPLIINVNERGLLKRIFNPGLEGVSTHWLVNVDTKPHRIGMTLTNVDVPLRWEVGAGIPWDPVSRTFKEAVAPGESVPDLGVDWIFEFPRERRSKNVWYEGELIIFDADTGENLTVFPLKFQVGRGK